MDKIRQVSIIVLTMLTTLPLFDCLFMDAYGEPISYEATCASIVWVDKCRTVMKTCTTTIDDDNDTNIDCYVKDINVKKNTGGTGCTVYIKFRYNCEFKFDTKKRKGQWVCHDDSPLRRPDKDQFFTEEEFFNTQTRCSRYCGKCSAGWKSE